MKDKIYIVENYVLEAGLERWRQNRLRQNRLRQNGRQNIPSTKSDKSASTKSSKAVKYFDGVIYDRQNIRYGDV